MAEFIEVPVLCHTAASQQLEGLEIAVSDDLLESRDGIINREAITYVIPSADPDQSVINFSGLQIVVMMPFTELKQLLT